MKIFQCSACSQPVNFEDRTCASCTSELGYDCRDSTMVALGRTEDVRTSTGFRRCGNADHGACNWLIPEGSADLFCAACRHNRMVPDLTSDWNLTRWRAVEAAKHRLFYSLFRFRLPLATREERAGGLAFDFLADPSEVYLMGPAIMTGHQEGLITLNIAEADDVERERRRNIFGEHYRTLLGHFRHEIGHYFWNQLVRDRGGIAEFRDVFGNEDENYVGALQVYYTSGARAGWRDDYVSAYATAHPWEDFAETWSHYFHIVDTLETARVFGLRVEPRTATAPPLPSVIDFDPYRVRDVNRLIEAWLPLTYAVNSLNRSMGQPDLYPFVLSPRVIGKLAFVHHCIVTACTDAPAHDTLTDTLKAVIAGLRSPIPAPLALD